MTQIRSKKQHSKPTDFPRPGSSRWEDLFKRTPTPEDLQRIINEQIGSRAPGLTLDQCIALRAKIQNKMVQIHIETKKSDIWWDIQEAALALRTALDSAAEIDAEMLGFADIHSTIAQIPGMNRPDERWRHDSWRPLGNIVANVLKETLKPHSAKLSCSAGNEAGDVVAISVGVLARFGAHMTCGGFVKGMRPRNRRPKSEAAVAKAAAETMERAWANMERIRCA